MFYGARRVFAAVLFLTAGVFATAQSRTIYSATADAHADIAQAIHTATREHKRILLDFGGNWCGDCQVLDIYFHQSPNDAIVEKNFVVVHVDIGRMDKNVDVADKYGVPLKRGVPALAVLSSHGKLLYSQKNGEFEAMRRMDPASVTEFLNKWSPKS
jgi:thioredoxin 1